MTETIRLVDYFYILGSKKGFLIQGEDRVGALVEILGKLSAAKINVTATDAVSAGAGQFGAILWVKAPYVKKAAKLLGVGAAAVPQPAPPAAPAQV
jgi:hypothetical protein